MDYSNLKKNLRELAEKKRKAKEEEDKIRQAKNEEDRNTMLTAMSKDFGNVFKPYLEQIKEHSSLTSKELSRLIAESVQINVPGIDTSSLENAVKSSIAEAMGSLRFPTPQSTVNIPEIKIPPVNMPKEMDIKGWIGMMGYDKGLLQNPFPVQIRDANGKPVDLASIGGQTISGGGGKMDFFTVKGITNTIGVVTINPDGSPVYSGGSSGLTDTELRASALQVIQLSGTEFSTVVNSFLTSLETKQVSGTIDSVNVVGFSSSVAAVPTNAAGLSGDIPSGTYGNGQLMYRPHDASAFGDAYANNPQNYVDENYNQIIQGVFPFMYNGSTWDRVRGDTATGMRVSASQVSGAAYSVSVIDVFGSAAANVVNPDGRLKVELPTGSSGLTDTELRASHLDVQQLSGSIDSVFVTGFADSIAVFQARTTNPTAKSDGADVRPSADDLGRQIVRPFQVRDLTKTAYVTLTNGTETTLLAATAGAFNDMVQIIGTNNSSVAVQVDIRAVTGGNIVTTLYIPATSTAGATFTLPLPQNDTGNNWTADMGDITGTTVTISALFVQEV